jgi:serine protease Do
MGAIQDAGPAEADRVTPVVRAVQKAAPSVVSITTGRSQTRAFFWQPPMEGGGSGVIVDKDGLVITNWHVIWNQGSDAGFFVKVTLNDGSEFMADVVSEAPEHDLALLKIRDTKGKQFVPIVMGSSSSLMIGETLIAIGNPRGQASSVTVGILSATERTIQVPWPNGRPHKFEHLLQTDAAVNPGNSGGALLDITGKLIGINNAIRTDAVGINFAIPVDKVRQVFNDVLLSYDGSGRFWLGMRVDASGKTDGVLVSSVERAGPAAEAGLRSGDRIVAVNGREVTSHIEFAKQLLDLNPGQEIRLRVRSGRDEREIPLSLQSSDDAALIRLVGMLVRPVTPRDDERLLARATLAYTGGRGRVRGYLPVVFEVTRVVAGGPAAALGLEAGDVIFATAAFNGWGQRFNVAFQGGMSGLIDRLREYAGNQVTILVLQGKKRESMEGELMVRREND